MKPSLHGTPIIAATTTCNGTIGIISLDSTHSIVFISRVARQMFGYESAEVLGQQASMLLPELELNDAVQQSTNLDVAGGSSTVEFRIVGKRKDGTMFPAWLDLNEVNVGTHGEPMFIGIISDISERNVIERESLQHHDQLTETVAMATHELQKTVDQIQKIASCVPGAI